MNNGNDMGPLVRGAVWGEEYLWNSVLKSIVICRCPLYKEGCSPAIGVQARRELSPLHRASRINHTCCTTIVCLYSLFCKSVLASQAGELFAGPQGWSDQGMLLARPENNFFF